MRAVSVILCIPLVAPLAFAQGDRADIPWKVEIAKPELTYDQRFDLSVTIRIDGKTLVRRGGGNLETLVEIEDSQGHVYRDRQTQSPERIQREMRRIELVITHRALVTPGDYKVSVALDDRVDGAHNLRHAVVHAEIPKTDLLPNSWDGMPQVEILPKVAEPEAFFRPELAGHLHLPVENQAPVRMEVIARLPPWAGRGYFISRAALSALVPQLKALSEITLRNGEINVTLIDSIHSEAIEVTRHGQRLSWNLLRPGLVDPYSNVVDVRHYDPLHRAGSTEITRAIAHCLAVQDTARVVVVYLGVYTHEFAKPSGWRPPVFERHVEKTYVIDDFPEVDMGGEPTGPLFRRAPWNLQESGHGVSIEDILRALHPRVFSVRHPAQFRDALAAIIEDLSRI